MVRIGNAAVGVLRGSQVLFSACDDGGEMWTGTGPRVHREPVRFTEAFQSAPVIHVSISMLDMSHSANLRADISADKVGPEGFEIVFRTWDDTRVARIRAEWLAIGAVRHEDDWEV